MSPARLAFGLLLLGSLGLTGGGEARAADEAAVLWVRAAELASSGRCAEALPLLRRAREMAPDDSRVALLEGECLFVGKRYADAASALEAASRLGPEQGRAWLLLGMARYHAGDVAGADAALARAEALLPESAEAALYRGLVLLDQQRGEESAAFFDSASELAPPGMEPAASYYAGLAHASAGRQEEAERALRSVAEKAPGSEWAQRAAEALDAATAEPALRRWAVVSGGLAYDSNVALRGEEVALPSDVSGQADGRGVWGVDAGTELFRKGAWGGGGMVSYAGSAQFRETEFDRQYIGVALWVDRLLGERSYARVQPEFGATFLDYDDYLRFYGVLAELGHDFGRAGAGQGWVRYAWNDFLYPILGTPEQRRQRNRDGNDLSVGYDHALPVGKDTLLQGGPFFRYYGSVGREFRHTGVGGWLGVRQQLPCRFAVEVRGSYAFASYQNPSSFLEPGEKREDRRDWLGGAEVRIERPLTERISAEVHWLFYSSNSNTRVFDYDRNIVGALLTVAFGD